MKARITTSNDYMTIGPIGSRQSTLTAWRDVGGIGINTGCFTGYLPEFIKAVRKTHKSKSVCRKEYEAAIVLIKLRAKSWKPITATERQEQPNEITQ